MFSYVSPEQRIPVDHPLRPIRETTDEVLRQLSRAWACSCQTRHRVARRLDVHLRGGGLRVHSAFFRRLLMFPGRGVPRVGSSASSRVAACGIGSYNKESFPQLRVSESAVSCSSDAGRHNPSCGGGPLRSASRGVAGRCTCTRVAQREAAGPCRIPLTTAMHSMYMLSRRDSTRRGIHE